MKHTREQLDGMSKLQLNGILAELNGWKVTGNISDAVYVSGNEKGFTDRLVDYCNSYSETMVIAEQHISRIEKVNGVWFVDSNADGVYCWRFIHKDMLFAIACCLIMVMENKNDNS